jgi:hypothetical protein
MNKNNLKKAVEQNLSIPCDFDTEIVGLWTGSAAEIDKDLADYISATVLDLYDELFGWLDRRKPKGYRAIIQELDKLMDWDYSPRPSLLVSIEEYRKHAEAIRVFLRQTILPVLK